MHGGTTSARIVEERAVIIPTYDPVIQFSHRPGILDLSWGHPRPDLLPVAQWAEAGMSAAQIYGWRQLTYGRGAGPAPLVEWLGTPPRETFVTGGASHGLSLVASLLAGPGDVVLVDSPTYHLAFRILADTGATLVRAPADESGVDPDGVGRVLASLRAAGKRAPLLYLVPTFANPTGSSLPMPRRRELVALARRTGLLVVEDDTYRELCYAGAAPPSLWELASGDNVIRLGSFAKTVAPGLRLGWVNAPAPIIARLAALGYVDSGGGVNHATALTMACFAAGGAYQKHISAVRDEYRNQRDTLVAGLRPHIPVTAPDGGWFLWLRLPPGVTAEALLPVAESQGTSFVPGARFYAAPPGGADRIRLSFSQLPPDDLAEAAGRLVAALARLRPA